MLVAWKCHEAEDDEGASKGRVDVVVPLPLLRSGLQESALVSSFTDMCVCVLVVGVVVVLLVFVVVQTRTHRRLLVPYKRKGLFLCGVWLGWLGFVLYTLAVVTACCCYWYITASAPALLAVWID